MCRDILVFQFFRNLFSPGLPVIMNKKPGSTSLFFSFSSRKTFLSFARCWGVQSCTIFTPGCRVFKSFFFRNISIFFSWDGRLNSKGLEESFFFFPNLKTLPRSWVSICTPMVSQIRVISSSSYFFLSSLHSLVLSTMPCRIRLHCRRSLSASS